MSVFCHRTKRQEISTIAAAVALDARAKGAARLSADERRDTTACARALAASEHAARKWSACSSKQPQQRARQWGRGAREAEVPK